MVHIRTTSVLDTLSLPKMSLLINFVGKLVDDFYKGFWRSMDFIALPDLSDFTDEERQFFIAYVEATVFSLRIHPPAMHGIDDYFRETHLHYREGSVWEGARPQKMPDGFIVT